MAGWHWMQRTARSPGPAAAQLSSLHGSLQLSRAQQLWQGRAALESLAFVLLLPQLLAPLMHQFSAKLTPVFNPQLKQSPNSLNTQFCRASGISTLSAGTPNAQEIPQSLQPIPPSEHCLGQCLAQPSPGSPLDSATRSPKSAGHPQHGRTQPWLHSDPRLNQLLQAVP